MLGTKRLLLRDLVYGDLDDIHTLLSLPETDRYNALGLPESAAETQKRLIEWVNAQTNQPRTSYIFSVALQESNQFIGLIAIIAGKPNYRNAEIWFKIHVNHWNKGYTTEALLEMLKFGFNVLKLHRIEAGCAVENIASAKVLEKAGMVREGTKRKLIPKHGAWMDAYMYAILEEEFLQFGNHAVGTSIS